MNIFESQYAQFYDSIHAEKDYVHDVGKILKILNGDSLRVQVNNILDFGCGTGKHISLLHSHGFKVQGYDPSEEMLAIARQNFPLLSFSSDLSALQHNSDLVVSLFDVLSYQTTSEMVDIYFNQIHKLVLRNGHVLLDFWSLDGLRKNPPENRQKKFVFKGKTYERIVLAKSSEDLKLTELQISLIEHESKKVLYTRTHKMRAFQVEEIENLIGPRFELIWCKDAKDYTSPLSSNTWRAVALLRSK